MHSSKPNILLVLTDQHRFDTLSAGLNSFNLNTPALDALAAHGAHFENAFCTSPVCCPSRASLMTGLMPSQTGIPGNLSNAVDPIGPLCEGIFTIGDRMQAAGYQTVYHGKSHLGGDLAHYGFEIAYENSHDPSTVTEAARYWRNSDWIVNKRPFFHVVSLLNPHDIYFLDPDAERPATLPRWASQDDSLEGKPWPQRLKHMPDWSDERWQYYREFYASKVEKVDAQIGELIGELFCGGYGPNTWIIFAADHGDMAGEHGIAFKGPFMYEGVLRVPLIICPPRARMLGAGKGEPGGRRFQPFKTSVMASGLDLVPTILDIAGIEPDPKLEGRSLRPVVMGEGGWGDRDIFSEWHELGSVRTPIRTIRTADWKYNLYLNNGEELYDLKADPHEMNNLAESANHAENKLELRNRLVQHIEEIGDPFFSLRSAEAP